MDREKPMLNKGTYFGIRCGIIVVERYNGERNKNLEHSKLRAYSLLAHTRLTR